MNHPRDARPDRGGPDPGAVALEEALARKDALLRELDHRVKNNLQLIASLILLQSRRTTDEAARQALKTVLERVTAVATVHRRLFQGDPLRFDVADFVRELTGDLAAAVGRDGRIAISLAVVGDACVLTVADDGVGLGDQPPGFGLMIVKLLCQQLHAGLETADAQPGVRTTVTVPMTLTHAP